MASLADYIRSIHGLQPEPLLCHQETHVNHEDDDGYRIEQSTTTYEFGDGAVITCERETEIAPPEDDDTAACADSFSDYRVIKQPDSAITPSSKAFTNHCQEQFWLKIQP